MSFINRIENNQYCIKCNNIIPINDLWFDEECLCKHGNLYQIKIKYDCFNCKYYQEWYILKACEDEQCLECKLEQNHRNNMEKLYLKPELYELSSKDNNRYYDFKYFNNKERLDEYIRKHKLTKENYNIDNLTCKLTFNVKNLNCQGHWLYENHDYIRCMTCGKNKYGYEHCCCYK